MISPYANEDKKAWPGELLYGNEADLRQRQSPGIRVAEVLEQSCPQAVRYNPVSQVIFKNGKAHLRPSLARRQAMSNVKSGLFRNMHSPDSR